MLFIRLFDLCLFDFVWEGLRFVVVALPGLFCLIIESFVEVPVCYKACKTRN